MCISSQHHFRHHFSSLRSTVVGVFTPWKLENATNQGGFFLETEEVNGSSLMSDWTWRMKARDDGKAGCETREFLA